MRRINCLLTAQLSFIILLSITLFMVSGRQVAISALLGGLVAFVPAVLFAKKCFQHQGARAAKQIMRNIYIGECLKIISSILLFTLVFIVYKVAPLAFFLAYIAVVMTHWLAPLIIDNKQTGPKSD